MRHTMRPSTTERASFMRVHIRKQLVVVDLDCIVRRRHLDYIARCRQLEIEVDVVSHEYERLPGFQERRGLLETGKRVAGIHEAMEHGRVPGVRELVV